jgi:flagellar motor protein MotB
LLAKKPLNANYHYKLGMCLLESKDKKDALEHLETATGSGKFSKNYDPYDDSEELAPIEALAYLARAQHLNGKPEDAIESYELLKTKIKNEGHLLLKDMPRQLEQCEEAKLQMKSPKNHKINNVGTAINSEYKDFNGVAPKDMSILYFSSNRERPDGSNAKLVDPETMEFEDDLYMSFRGSSGKWGPAELLNINSDKGDRVTGVTADGHTLFISKGPRDDAEFYMSKLVGERWTDPVPLSASVNSQFQEMDMAISPDGKTIYFTSNRPNGLGGFDIYRAKLEKNGEWGEAENLGELVNTKYSEVSPSIGGNGKILYFSSEGHNTMGGFDLFSCKIDAKGNIGNTVNVGYPLSTTDDDYYFQAVPISRKGFITSSKIGGSGLQDIYEVTLARDPNEAPVVLKGNLISLSKSIPAGLKLLAKAKEEDLKVEAAVDATSGLYELKLPPCANYKVQVMLEKIILNEYEVEAVCDESVMTIEHETYVLPIVKRPPPKVDLTAEKSKKDNKADKKAEKEKEKAEKEKAKADELAAKEKEVLANMKFSKKAKPVKEKPAGETEKISPTKYYFTYGVFRVKLEDMGLFVEEVAVLIEKRGITEIDVYASSSKVPRSNKKSNEELSEQRADDAMIVIRKELQRMGYEEGVHYKFRKIDSA